MNYHYQLLNLPNRQVKVFMEFKLQKNCNQSYLSKIFPWLVKMTHGLVVHASYSLPEMAIRKTDFLCTLHYD